MKKINSLENIKAIDDDDNSEIFNTQAPPMSHMLLWPKKTACERSPIDQYFGLFLLLLSFEGNNCI